MPVPLSSGDESSSRNGESQPLRLLFAGKIEFEHGIACLLAALGRLTERPQLATRLQVDICGTGSKESWLVDNLQQMGGLQIRYHGFLSDEKYKCFSLKRIFAWHYKTLMAVMVNITCHQRFTNLWDMGSW